MNLKKTIASGAVLLALTVPAAFAAQEGQTAQTDRHVRVRGFGRHLPGRLAAKLNLKEEQKQFARQLMADTRKQAQPIAAQLRENRKELTEAVKANNLGLIDQVTQRQGVLMGQLGALRSKAMASFYAQLTPEQKATADQLQSRFKDRAARRMQRQ